MRLFHALKRSFSDFQRHPWLHGLSIVTITASLMVLGAFLLGYENFSRIARQAGPEIVGTAYLADGLNELEVMNLKDRILAEKYVKRVDFKTKESVFKDLNGFYGTDGLGEGSLSALFPNLLEITLEEHTPELMVEQLRDAILSRPEISQVDFSTAWHARYLKMKNILRWTGIGLLISLIVGCSFIIANFMGMRHQARRRDIEIIQLMGASRRYVLMPFLWEGLLEGLFGVGLALLGLVVFRFFLMTGPLSQFMALAGVEEVSFLTPSQLGFMLGAGVLMAFVGSITVFLKFSDNR